MHRNPSYDPVSDDRPPVADVLFGRVCRATPADVGELCAALPEATRARLALFCNARAHLRDVGRAIANRCSQESLTAEGGLAGAVLFGQIAAAPETWNVPFRAHSKRISLAG